MSDHNLVLFWHLPNLLGHCPMSDSNLQPWNIDIPVSDESSGAKPATLQEHEAPTASLNQPCQTGKRRQLSLHQLFPNKKNPSFMVTMSSEETSTVDSNLVERATIGEQSTTSSTDGSNPPSQCSSQSCSVPNDIGNYISAALELSGII